MKFVNKQRLIETMKINAKAHNSALTDEHLETLSTKELLAYTHPQDRIIKLPILWKH